MNGEKNDIFIVLHAGLPGAGVSGVAEGRSGSLGQCPWSSW